MQILWTTNIRRSVCKSRCVYLKNVRKTEEAIKNGQSALNETNRELSIQLILDLNELEKANAILRKKLALTKTEDDYLIKDYAKQHRSLESISCRKRKQISGHGLVKKKMNTTFTWQYQPRIENTAIFIFDLLQVDLTEFIKKIM